MSALDDRIDSARPLSNRLQLGLRDVHPAFRAAVGEGRHRGRSVSLAPTGSGYRIRHVGFLGGAAPRLTGWRRPSQANRADATSAVYLHRREQPK